jgi:hypothetical protein
VVCTDSGELRRDRSRQPGSGAGVRGRTAAAGPGGGAALVGCGAPSVATGWLSAPAVVAPESRRVASKLVRRCNTGVLTDRLAVIMTGVGIKVRLVSGAASTLQGETLAVLPRWRAARSPACA